MIIGDVEHIVISLAAFALIAAIVLVIADTPAYPIALGVEIIAILYLVFQPATIARLKQVGGVTGSLANGASA